MELGSTEFWQRLKEDPARLAVEVCTIDMVDLDATLIRHPALVAWVAATYETAKVLEARAKWDVTKARAIAMLRLKAQPDKDTGKWKV